MLAALYYGSAQIGINLNFVGPVAAIVWPPVGVGIAFLYLRGLSFWPGVLVGDLLANDYSALPLGSAPGQTRRQRPRGGRRDGPDPPPCPGRLAARRPSAGSLRMLVAIAAGVGVSATIGALSLRLGDVISTDAVGTIWRTWWLGDFCGALIVAPLVLAWSPPPQRGWRRGRTAEAAVGLVAVAALSRLRNAHRPPGDLPRLPRPDLVRASVRPARRHPGRRDRGLRDPLEHDALPGPVRLPLDQPHRAEHPALCDRWPRSRRWSSPPWCRSAQSSRAVFVHPAPALIRAGDVERRRLERNLHDGAQQRLTWLAVDLGHAAERARASPEQAAGLLEEAEVKLELAIAELRELAHGIHPAVLTDLGLAAPSGASHCDRRSRSR